MTRLLLCAFFAINAQADITKLKFKKDIVPLLEKYCYKCHDDDVQKGDLNMKATLEVADTIAKNHKTWEHVIEQVHTGEMPPKKPLMTHIERNRLLDWLHFQMKNIDWSRHKKAGHVTLPRLTREEYNNTIRDLLGWNRKAGNKFGEDGIGKSGFNNDRDGLFVSAAQAEKYFDAAEKIIHDYVNSSAPPETKVFEAEKMLITDEFTKPRSWGFLIGRTQDTVYTFASITRQGYYELTIRGWGRKYRSNAIPEMHVLIDNKLKARARLNATPEHPADYKLIVYLDEGNHQISFNAKRLSATPAERMLPVNPMEKIDIFGNLPLGQNAEKLCTTGLNFMALDKITLIGPLKNLPAKTPLQEKVETLQKTKKPDGPPFESDHKFIPLKVAKADSTNADVKKFLSALQKLQEAYNQLRHWGPNAAPKDILGAIIEIETAEAQYNKTLRNIKKVLIKSPEIIKDFQESNKKVFAANKSVRAKAKKIVKQNAQMSAEEKKKFIEKYTGEQWLFCRDVEGFIAPPDTKTVFFVKPGSGLSERNAARKIISRFASRAFRRPATESEIENFLSLFDNEKKLNRSYSQAIQLPLAAILTSPKFLYRYENSRAATQEYKLDDYQLASRLSYFLWMSMPDQELSALAKAGKLSDPKVLKQQVNRMIQDPKLKAFTKTFARQWLGYHELGKSKIPDEMTFPQFTEDLRKDMMAETDIFMHELISKNDNMLNILDSNYSYLNERLAIHYGVKGVKGPEFRKVIFKNKMRGGALGMGSILTATSQPIRTSPVDRGTWVLETLMGKHLPEPPADVPPLPENAGGKDAKMTLRKSLELHRASEQCAACHDKIDPIGFGLENFDPIGRWRSKNFGRKIDAQGILPSGEVFKNPYDLRKLLVKKESDFARNMAERFLSFSLGRKLEFYDEPVLKELVKKFIKSGFKAHDLIENIVLSYPFLHQNKSR